MTYLAMPGSLNSADQVLAWLKQLQAEGRKFAEELLAHSEAGTLTLDILKGSLDQFTWLMAGVDQAYEALEEIDADFDIDEALSDMAGAVHEFGNDMTMSVVGKLRELGANANLLRKEAQDRHYPAGQTAQE